MTMYEGEWLPPGASLVEGSAPHVSVDEIVLGATMLASSADTPLLGSVAGWPGWAMDGTANDAVGHLLKLPAHWATFNVAIYWSNSGTGTGNVVWMVRTTGISAGDGDTLTTPSGGTNVVAAAQGQHVLELTTLASGLTAVAGKLTTLRVFRLGSNASDTLADDVSLRALVLTRAS